MTGPFGALQSAETASPASWAFDGLHPFDAYDVGSVIPEGFEVYAAVLHAERSDDDQVYGELAAEDVSVLASVLGRATTTPGRCWLCLWEGWGWLHVSTGSVSPLGTGADGWRSAFEDVERFVAATPRVGTRDRRYHLLVGPIDSVHELRDPAGFSQPPSLWWPDDRAWIVASEIDLSWTYVAGTQTVVDEVVASWRFGTRIVSRDGPHPWTER